jgi:hypothetical protein
MVNTFTTWLQFLHADLHRPLEPPGESCGIEKPLRVVSTTSTTTWLRFLHYDSKCFVCRPTFEEILAQLSSIRAGEGGQTPKLSILPGALGPVPPGPLTLVGIRTACYLVHSLLVMLLQGFFNKYCAYLVTPPRYLLYSLCRARTSITTISISVVVVVVVVVVRTAGQLFMSCSVACRG